MQTSQESGPLAPSLPTACCALIKMLRTNNANMLMHSTYHVTIYVLSLIPRACVILGVIFILSSLCILGKAIHDLATKLLPEVVRI